MSRVLKPCLLDAVNRTTANPARFTDAGPTLHRRGLERARCGKNVIAPYAPVQVSASEFGAVPVPTKPRVVEPFAAIAPL